MPEVQAAIWQRWGDSHWDKRPIQTDRRNYGKIYASCVPDSLLSPGAERCLRPHCLILKVDIYWLATMDCTFCSEKTEAFISGRDACWSHARLSHRVLCSVALNIHLEVVVIYLSVIIFSLEFWLRKINLILWRLNLKWRHIFAGI